MTERLPEPGRIGLTSTKHNFGNLALVGSFEPVPEDFNRRSVDNFGLPPVFMGVFAWVKSDSGRYFHVFRMVHSVMTSHLRLTSARAGQPGKDHVEAKESFHGYVREDADTNGWTLSGARGASQSIRFKLECDRSLNATWDESSILSLRCKRLGPAIEMVYPDAHMPWYWNTLICRIEGEILGERVAGFGEIEFSWGSGWQDWLEHPLHAADYWLFFTIESTDGSIEYGTIGLSNDFGFGVVIRNGRPEALYGVVYGGSRTPEGIPTSVWWRHGNREWTLTLQTESIGSSRNPGYLWQLGTLTCSRVGSAEAIKSSYGFVETRSAERPYHLAPATGTISS